MNNTIKELKEVQEQTNLNTLQISEILELLKHTKINGLPTSQNTKTSEPQTKEQFIGQRPRAT